MVITIRLYEHEKPKTKGDEGMIENEEEEEEEGANIGSDEENVDEPSEVQKS